MDHFITCSVERNKGEQKFKRMISYGRKKVELYVTFPKEGKSDYRKTFKNYQKKNSIKRPDYVMDNIPCVVFHFLSNTIAHILRPYTHLIKGNLKLYIVPNRVRKHAERMAYYPGKSNKKEVHLTIEWYHILETIVHPYFTKGDINMRALSETILHEFVGHYGDQIHGLDSEQAAIEEQIESIGVPLLRVFNQLLFDLRAEGLARFYELKHTEYTRIHMKWLHTFQHNVRKLISRRTPHTMEKFYYKKLYVEEGLYHAGMVMCITIAMAQEALERKKKALDAEHFFLLTSGLDYGLAYTKYLKKYSTTHSKPFASV